MYFEIFKKLCCLFQFKTGASLSCHFGSYYEACFILWAIARTTLWAVTLSMPRYVYRRNAMSAFTSAKRAFCLDTPVHPQLCPIPAGNPFQIFPSFFLSSSWKHKAFFTLSSIGILLLFPLIHFVL